MNINRMISKYNFNPGQINRIMFIVIHYTGSLGSAKNNAQYFGSKNLSSSAHYFVGHEGDIWQVVEDKNIAWHCGAKTYKHPICRNANSIGIEMCCKFGASGWYFEDKTVKAAIELTKELMNKYHVPVENVIRHYDVTGKNCPAPYVSNKGKHTWSEFKTEIARKGSTTMDASKDITKKIWDFFILKGLNSYAAAGIMGNLYDESHFKTNNLQNSFENKLGMDDETYTAAVNSGAYSAESFTNDKAGYGLAQWTFWSRKKKLYEYAVSQKKSIDDLEMQLEFLWSEISANKALVKQLKAASSVPEASNLILHVFEKPADQSAAVENRRAGYGDTFYVLYSGDSKEKKESPKVNDDKSFVVKVDTPFLNIRKGPGSSYEKIGRFTGIGKFTIVETQTGEGSVSGWGKLKSGLGWIALDFVTRV